MKLATVTCTKGRHTLLERSLGMMLAQDYEGEVFHLIFNNSSRGQRFDKFQVPKGRRFCLVNQNKHNGQPYSNLHEIFADAMSHLPEDVDVVTFFDDDDIFLHNHLSEGMKGYRQALVLGKLAYKPYYSFLQTAEGIQKTHNTCEPSWFVSKAFIDQHGFKDHSAAYHDGWIHPILRHKLLHEPEDGTPTFVYQWVGGCYHISGDGENPENFQNHSRHSTDEGDGIITPKL